MKLYQGVAKILTEQPGGRVFGLLGDANLLYLAEYIRMSGGHFTASTHEAGAVAMADGYSRMSGTSSVASITHGPALTNAVTALVEAVRNRSRVVLITGDTPQRHGHQQAIDIPAVVAPTGAGYERVFSAATAAADVYRAFRRAEAEERPVVLNVPFDALSEEIAPPPGPRQPDRPGAVAPDDNVLDRALGIIASAQRPILLAGRGAVRSGAHSSMRELAEILGAPVATTLLAKDWFAGLPYDLGIFGSLSTPAATTAIAAADCVIAFGAGLNRFTTGNGDLLRGKRLVRCDIDISRTGATTDADVVVTGDATAIAERMTAQLNAVGWQATPWCGEELAEQLARDRPYPPFRDRSGRDTVDIRTAMVRLDQLLPRERSVVTDVGRFAATAWRYLHAAHPSRFAHTANFASIGLGLGNAIGAAFAHPSTTTVCVAGDGGFMMNVSEFATAVRNQLPLVVIVVNDGAYGAEYAKLRSHGFDPALCFSEWPDLAGVSRAMGGRGITVRTLADLDDATGALTAPADGPLLVDVRMDPGLDIDFE